MSNSKRGLASLNVKSVTTKKSSILRQSRKSLIQEALKIAQTDFFKAFHMVHNSHMTTSVGIVGIKINERKKDAKEE